MKWARVEEDGLIAEFTFIDPHGRFHPSLVWVEVDDSVQIYSRFTNTGIEPPVPHEEIKGGATPPPEDKSEMPPPRDPPRTDAVPPAEGFTVQVEPA